MVQTLYNFSMQKILLKVDLTEMKIKYGVEENKTERNLASLEIVK